MRAAVVTARERVLRARTYLAVSVAVAAAGWALAAALVAGVALVIVPRLTVELPSGVVAALPPVAALFAASFVIQRAWPGRSLERVALWIEEHEPALAFALVTANDPTLPPSPSLERAAAFDLRGVLGRPLMRMLLGATAAVAVSGIVAWAVMGGDGTRDIVAGRTPAAVLGGAAAPADPLSGIRATVTPPPYSRLRATSMNEPSSMTGLRGSRIAVTGRGPGVSAFLGDGELQVANGRRWSVAFTMPAQPVALILRHGDRRRVIVLEPRADAAPKVRLISPARDTIMRRPGGSVRVMAAVDEDIGIADGFIEYMVSSGAEETFAARTVVTGARDFGGAVRGNVLATIDLGLLKLGPGDLVSIRAVARDANNVSGRGVGVSDTRTYRVARGDEYDSLAVEAGAPIIAESTVVSQRMLILRTEALLREQRALTRDSVLTRVRGIAVDQVRLRERVHDIIYPAHAHADGEVEAQGEPEDAGEGSGPINPHLKTAYEEMWSATRELQIAEPGAALPFMKAAAAAIDRGRMANRYYLRSGSSRVVVDVPRVRLRGTEKGTSAAREPHLAERTRQEIAREFARAAAIRDAAVAANELSLLRVRALGEFPEFAAALEAAIEALRRGRDPRAAIAIARNALERPDFSAGGGAGWSRW